MKRLITILLFLLSIYGYAQSTKEKILDAKSQTYSKAEQDLLFKLQEERILTLQRDINSIGEQVTTNISRQDKSLDRGLDKFSSLINLFAVFIAIVSIAAAFLIYFLNRRTKRIRMDMKNELQKVNKMKSEIVRCKDDSAALKELVEEELERISGVRQEIISYKNEADILKKEVEEDRNQVSTLKDTITQLYKTAEITLEGMEEKDKRAEEILQKAIDTLPWEQPEEVKQEIAFYVEESLEPEATLTAQDWFIKGYNEQIKEEFEDACFYYKKAIKLDPEYFEAYYNWGTSLCEIGDIKSDASYYCEALEKFGKAAELNPTHANTFYNWGNALADLGNLESDPSTYLEGFEKYKKAAELSPDDCRIYNNWGNALLTYSLQDNKLLNNKEMIEEVLEKANNIQTGSGSYNLACLYALLDKKDLALYYLEDALKYNLHDTKETFENDLDFINLRGDIRFSQLLDKYFCKVTVQDEN